MRTEFPAEEAHLAVEEIGEEVLDAVYSAMEAVGPEIILHIQDRSGVPYPPASKAGTYPHQRTGEFVEGLSASFDFADTTLTIWSLTHDHHGWFLQHGIRDGTKRPYANLMLRDRDWGARITELAREAMEQ